MKSKLKFDSKLVLENQRVRLTPLELDHVKPLSPIVLQTPDILKYSPPKFGTVELLETYVKNNIGLRAQGLKYPFVIFDKEVQAYAGSTSLMNFSMKDQRLEIGSTWLGVDYQRTGLNRNCKFLLLRYAFEVLGMLRVELKTDGRNIQSQTAIKAIGAQYEGSLRSHTLMSDGYRRDTVYFSILKDEWPDIKGSIFEGF